MNRIQKTATAIVALTITLTGATLVTAPLVLADAQPAALHHHASARQVANQHTTSGQKEPAARCALSV